MYVFDRHPSRYRHWKLSFDKAVATLAMDVDEAGGLVEGYALKLNSYDLGVDMEFHDALQRVRFEHPEVKTVVVTSAKERMFCAGANIYMLGASSHAWKVNFCKFTNETRNGMEDSSRHSGLKFLAAVNGSCAGGGYEIVMACDEILMVDDRSTTVSLPEVPLLGVLPGTGGLSRLVDKRGVRRDLADLFCTNPDGVRADRAKAWGLVDAVALPREFAAKVKARALELAALSDRPEGEGRRAAAAQPPDRGREPHYLRFCIGRLGSCPTPRHHHCEGPVRPSRGRSPRHPGRRLRLVAAGHGPRARRRHFNAAPQCLGHRSLGPEGHRRGGSRDGR